MPRTIIVYALVAFVSILSIRGQGPSADEYVRLAEESNKNLNRDAAVEFYEKAAAEFQKLGNVEKLFFESADPDSVPVDAHLIGNPRSADTGSYMLKPLGMPVIEGFFGGDWLAEMDEDSLAEKGREELSNLLGSVFARKLRPIAFSDWKNHAFICGSYSYARPGQHGARSALRARIDGPLAFAGEACSDMDYATVHAAWTSGIGGVEQLFGSAP